MPFTTRHSGQAAIAPGHTAGPGSQRIASLATLLFCVALISGLLVQPVHAQSVAQPATASGSTSSSNATESDDPVARFLADKGLMPSKRPVAELAQQMRDTASDIASELVLSAMNFLGVPYRRGGSSKETGFDCSGFTRHVFENSIGLILPRRAIEQANSPALMPVQQAELKPGDHVLEIGCSYGACSRAVIEGGQAAPARFVGVREGVSPPPPVFLLGHVDWYW